jgi:integrase
MRILRLSHGRRSRLGRALHENTHREITWTKARAWLMATYHQRAKATRAKITNTIDELEREAVTPADVEPDTIARLIMHWQAQMNRATTVNSKLRVVRAVLFKLGPRIPTCRQTWEAGPWFVREDDDWIPTQRKHLNPAELLRVLEQADEEVRNSDIGTSTRGRQPRTQEWYAHRRRALVWLLASTGLRATEALTARSEDFDGEILEVTSAWKRTKTTKSRQPVPVIEPASTRMIEWMRIRGESEWIFPASTKDTPWLQGSRGYKPLDQLKALGERSGVIGVTLQSFRHTFATMSELWGLSETQIQRILRHTTTLTQRHYRHADRQILKSIAEHITFDRTKLGSPERTEIPKKPWVKTKPTE